MTDDQARRLTALLRFVRTPSLGRTVAALLAAAFVLLLGASVLTFAMVRQTAALQAAVEHTQEVRLTAQRVLTLTVDAETGQRGYLLAGRPQYLAIYNEALEALPAELDTLERLLADNPGQSLKARRIRYIADERLLTLRHGVELAATGRIGEAVSLIRSGRGKILMDAMRAEVAALDAEEARLLALRNAAASRSATATLAVNAVAAVLIIALAAVCVWLVRRYLADVEAGRAALDRANVGLEATVRSRTADLLRANEEVLQARDRAEALLREVNHRVGNSLQLVSSFMSLQRRELKDEGARAALREAQARIEAVAHVHRRLYTSADVAAVAMEEYLAGLVEELTRSVGAGDRAVTVTLRAEPMRLSTDQAVSLGVVVTELVTNAVKYAYGPGQSGEIRVHLLAEGEHHGVLVVEDDGAGMDGGAPKGTGLGGKIVSAMARGLKSAVEFDPSHRGVRARLAFERCPCG